MRDKKILVIDDSIFVQSALKGILFGSYEVFFECSGEAALEFLYDRSVDLIILDINMAGIDGFETLRRLRAAGINAPVVFLTSEPKDSGADKAASLGAVGYILKPFDKAELLQTVDSLLAP